MNRLLTIRNLSHHYAHHITVFEASLMQRFCSLRRVGWIKILFVAASRLGDGPLWIMTATWLLLRGDPPARMAVLAALIAALVSVAVFVAIKNVIGRPRPFETWPGVTCMMAPPDKFSFPSGHTMTAFAVWASLSPALPALLLPYLLCAILIGLSRIFLGLHYPTDVLVGALLGSGIGLFTAFLLL